MLPLARNMSHQNEWYSASNNATLAVRLTQLQGSRAILPSKPHSGTEMDAGDSPRLQSLQECALHLSDELEPSTKPFYCSSGTILSPNWQQLQGKEGNGEVVPSPPPWLERVRVCSGCLTTLLYSVSGLKSKPVSSTSYLPPFYWNIQQQIKCLLRQLRKKIFLLAFLIAKILSKDKNVLTALLNCSKTRLEVSATTSPKDWH